MNPLFRRFLVVFFLVAAISLPLENTFCGAGEKEEEGHGHEESPSGASFKAGKGVIVADETKKILGIEVADVVEEEHPQVIQFDVQVFGEKHRFAHEEVNHSGCEIHGSGLVPPDRAAPIEAKQPVTLVTAANEKLEGFVVAVKKVVAYGESEVIVGVTSQAKLKDGEFVKAIVRLPGKGVATVIPQEALIRTSQGTFVYVVNGNAYLRTAVQVGSEADGKLEITDGLFAGDQVVTKPVQTLWLIELRATKGGGHSH